jgi:hypothetical protein
MMLGITKLICQVLFVTLTFQDALNFSTVLANPFGSSSCTGSEAAVGGIHLASFKVVDELSFADAGLTILLNDVAVDDKSNVELAKGTDYVLSVNGSGMRGVLIRLEGGAVDTAGALQPKSNTKVAEACEAPIVGLTHKNPLRKNAFEGMVRFDVDASNIIFDITVVLKNGLVSRFAYGAFTANFL